MSVPSRRDLAADPDAPAAAASFFFFPPRRVSASSARRTAVVSSWLSHPATTSTSSRARPTTLAPSSVPYPGTRSPDAAASASCSSCSAKNAAATSATRSTPFRNAPGSAIDSSSTAANKLLRSHGALPCAARRQSGNSVGSGACQKYFHLRFIRSAVARARSSARITRRSVSSSRARRAISSSVGPASFGVFLPATSNGTDSAEADIDLLDDGAEFGFGGVAAATPTPWKKARRESVSNGCMP